MPSRCTVAGGADKRQPAVFFPMREMADDGEASRDVSIPKTLDQHLAYAYAAIPWKSPNPATNVPKNRPGREFLDSADLVSMPRTRELLVRIAAVPEHSVHKQKHAERSSSCST